MLEKYNRGQIELRAFLTNIKLYCSYYRNLLD
jgi:hypothetical protein